MKRLYPLFALLILTKLAAAQVAPDTTKKTPPVVKELPKNKQVFTAIEQEPQYPGGTAAFGNYISRNLKYPDVARLVGIDGRLIMSFIVERDGRISSATPVNCIGAGCEAEAVKVLQESKPWTPGVQNGRAVRVQYTVPINFSVEKGKVKMKELRASDYGFVFNIKDRLYTLDEAKDIIGGSFQSDRVKIAEPFYNTDNNPKFLMPDKKEVYVVKMKD
ncbi:energy transducer TonB [Mucilaginibacter sp. ZT4R22]|uniref:Energy transducer TonB n=1 Tax=Mucilaginibacter pankratovii TaxID=2772110 RepID=A0ABR7WV51_9SPHI|nr:energy transducer TonB [Mucilaginibacter pankratovii]MBD1366178.1 energy transducer TonB [Mucilaginibacter pankratovii]